MARNLNLDLAGMASVMDRLRSLRCSTAHQRCRKVTQGETAKQVFTFTNKGSGTLEIMSVQPT